MTRNDIEMDYFGIIRQKVREVINNEEQSVAHRMDHIKRVILNTYRIAKSYPEADIEILKIAVLLHDINQPFEHKEEHVKLSVKTAEKILKEVGYPPNKIKKVLIVISEHSTEDVNKKKPTSMEAKILFDADKIDGLGASGIARVFSLFGQMGKGPLEAIAWYRKKINITLSNMQTREGRKIFTEKLKYVEEFLNKIEEENKSI